MDRQEEKHFKMTTEPVEKLVIKMAVPTIISMLVTSFYNMADTFFVGKIKNVSATAAVGVVFSAMAIIQALGFFFGHGSGNFISRMLGKQQIKEAETMATTALIYCFFIGAIGATLGIIFIEPLALLLGSTQTVLPFAKEYLRYILLGAPFMSASFVLNNQLRFQGNAFYSMIGMVSGAIINIGLDPLLIFTFDMGVAGAALATIISQFCSFFILIIGTFKGGNLRIKISRFSFKFYYIKAIFLGGIPSLGRQSIASVASIILNNVAGTFGDFFLASFAIVNRITMFANSAIIGFGQGFQPVCGFNYGAGKFDRVRKAYHFCIKVSTLFLICISILGFIFADNLISVFKDDAVVIKYGSMILRFQCISFTFHGLIIMTNMIMQNLGFAFKATFLSIARQGIFFIPLVIVLPRLFGETGLAMTQSIADLLAVTVSLPMAISVSRYLKKLQGENL